MTSDEIEATIGKCGCGHTVRYQTHSGMACNKIARCAHGTATGRVTSTHPNTIEIKRELPIMVAGGDLHMMLTDRMHGVCEVISDAQVGMGSKQLSKAKLSLGLITLTMIETADFPKEESDQTAGKVGKGGNKRKRNPDRWR